MMSLNYFKSSNVNGIFTLVKKLKAVVHKLQEETDWSGIHKGFATIGKSPFRSLIVFSLNNNLQFKCISSENPAFLVHLGKR